jgi:hypothetical protein
LYGCQFGSALAVLIGSTACVSCIPLVLSLTADQYVVLIDSCNFMAVAIYSCNDLYELAINNIKSFTSVGKGKITNRVLKNIFFTN